MGGVDGPDVCGGNAVNEGEEEGERVQGAVSG